VENAGFGCPCSSDGTYSVDYGRLTPLLVEAVKEQETKLASRLAEKQERIENLEREVAEMKTIMHQLIAMNGTKQ
jgi:predicted RNase H-like nuclease (RuvC/YqgF family)